MAGIGGSNRLRPVPPGRKSRTADRRSTVACQFAFRLCYLPPSGHSPRPCPRLVLASRCQPCRCTGVVCPGSVFAALFALVSGFLTACRVFGYGFGLFGSSVGVLRRAGQGQQRLSKSSAQLSGCDRLCPVRREVGKPPPALLDGHTLPQQQGRKLVKAGSGGKVLSVGSAAASPCSFQTWSAWSA